MEMEQAGEEGQGNENLFLMEFLVDSVKLDPNCTCAVPDGEMCVCFRFLDNDYLEICEADFSPKTRYVNNDDQTVKSGKSCLFSLSQEKTVECTENFNIEITLFRRMPEGWLPDKLQIGSATLNITNLFIDLLESIQTVEMGSPMAKTLKDLFDIYDVTEGKTDQIVGKIGVYIRLSCFGKLIVTQFQMNLEDKSVLFKDKEGKSLYRYKKAKKGGSPCEAPCTPKRPTAPQMMQNPCAGPCSTQMNGTFPPQQLGMQIDQPPPPPCSCTSQKMPYNPFNDSGFAPPPPCGISGQPPPCNECGQPLQQPGMYSPSNMYPGMGMNMGMSMNMGMNTMPPCTECGLLSSPGLSTSPCTECMIDPNAPCASPPTAEAEPEGNYQEIGAAMGGNSLTIRVHKDKGTAEQVDPNAPPSEGHSDDCSCVPGNIGAKKPQQQQQLNMRPGVQQSPFAFKMADRGQGAGGNVIVNPPVTTMPDGTQLTEFSDPNQERFVLRIGKKHEGVNKKQNLELELCTPKGPDLKPIPKKETRETQYEDQPGDGGGKKGKGKKGKGGKGKGKKGKKGKKK